jgi:S1-C subfamily serine protease
MSTNILLTVLFCHGFLVGQADPFIETISHVKQSIVPIACATQPDAQGVVTVKKIKGTAFFVNDEGSFVTAAHVISKLWDERGQPVAGCFPVIYVPNPSWPSIKWFQFGSMVMDETTDIAVCKTTKNPFADSALHLGTLHLVPDIPADGTSVAFTGFPQVVIPVTSRGNIALAGLLDKVVVDKTSWLGVTGGPLYVANGAVIGMMIERGAGDLDGMAFAKPASLILKFLSDHNIPIGHDKPSR